MKKYTMENLELLIKKNDYLIDTAWGMIETAMECYENEIIDDNFVKNYLLEEVNSGFIYIKNDI